MSIASAVALHRFGLGPQPGELAKADDPLAWLDGQVRARAAVLDKPGLVDTAQALEALATMRKHRQSLRQGQATPEAQAALQALLKTGRKALKAEIEARTAHASTTRTPFAEHWVRFWSNHLTVAATRGETIGLAGAYEREAIRPHVFGYYKDLLSAAVLHPGMLLYLDNHRSVGPSTRAAKRRGLGLNENLAREVLELHTLGVGSGYTQGDVESLAKALTGWMPFAPLRLRRLVSGGGVFISFAHEPGAKRLLGKTYRSDGEGQASAMLVDLAAHPATAQHLATKLASHFLADAPPAAAIKTLTKVFQDTGGDLAAMARAIVRLDGALEMPLQKIKTPQELMIAAARVLGPQTAFRSARKTVNAFAHRPYGAPSPAGWPDDAASWISPDALQKRADWATMVAKRTQVHPDMFVQNALGPLADEALKTAISRAQSRAQGLTLALMSPQFQRR